jgi:hypothetical protein
MFLTLRLPRFFLKKGIKGFFIDFLILNFKGNFGQQLGNIHFFFFQVITRTKPFKKDENLNFFTSQFFFLNFQKT